MRADEVFIAATCPASQSAAGSCGLHFAGPLPASPFRNYEEEQADHKPATLDSLAAAAHQKPASTDQSKPEAANGPAPAGEKYTLRYRFHKGEEIRSKVSQLATIETTIGGTTQSTEMVSISTKVWRITDVEKSGNFTFEYLVEEVDIRNRMSGREEVRYNSRTDKVPPLGYMDVAKTLGQTLSVNTIDPQGAVVKRDQRHRPVVDNSGSVLVMPLPKEAVPIGHVWALPVEVTVPLEDGSTKQIETRQRYELEQVEHGIATIAVETQILTPVSNPKIRAQLIQRMTKGHIRFDITAGRIVSQRTDLDERVLAFSGPDSSMHYVARFTEEPVTDTPAPKSEPPKREAAKPDAHKSAAA